MSRDIYENLSNIEELIEKDYFSPVEKKEEIYQNLSFFVNYPSFVLKYLEEYYSEFEQIISESLIFKFQEEKDFWKYIFYASLFNLKLDHKDNDFNRLDLFVQEIGLLIKNVSGDKFKYMTTFKMKGFRFLLENKLLISEFPEKFFSFYLKKPYLQRKRETLKYVCKILFP